MAGFFGLFDYTKPGPGVPKDAPPKSPFIVFFEILQRKFWNFVKINMMYLVFNLPAFLAGMFVMLMFFKNIIPDAMESPEKLFNDDNEVCPADRDNVRPDDNHWACTGRIRIYPEELFAEEHAFIWSDFKILQYQLQAEHDRQHCQFYHHFPDADIHTGILDIERYRPDACLVCLAGQLS